MTTTHHESRRPTAAPARRGDAVIPSSGATNAGSETRADSARVEAGYEYLDPNATKAAYKELNSALESLAEQVIFTIDQITPHLAEMQSLLSQRGKARKKVLKQAGLPSWTEYARGFASKLDVSVRTLQEHITRLRNPGRKPKPQAGKPAKQLRLDRRQQSALVRAQLAANDVIDSLKKGGDWHSAVAKYEKVAVTPSKLDSFVNLLKPEPDWKVILSELLAEIEQTSDLPSAVMTRVKAIRGMMGTPTLYVIPSVTFDCGGCRDMHAGIAEMTEAHPDWSDEQLAHETGCSPNIVRQAKVRFLTWKEVA